MPDIVAFTGLKGSGKDTAASVMKRFGYREVKFADPLKTMVRAYLEFCGIHPENIERMIEGDLKEVPHPVLQGKTPRYVMQTLGTEWGRKMIGEDIWVDAWERNVLKGGSVVCSDLRFPNEEAKVRQYNGRIFRVVRDGVENNDPHPSEAHVATMNVDEELHNDFSSAEEFKDYIDFHMRTFA